MRRDMRGRRRRRRRRRRHGRVHQRNNHHHSNMEDRNTLNNFSPVHRDSSIQPKLNLSNAPHNLNNDHLNPSNSPRILNPTLTLVIRCHLPADTHHNHNNSLNSLMGIENHTSDVQDPYPALQQDTRPLRPKINSPHSVNGGQIPLNPSADRDLSGVPPLLRLLLSNGNLREAQRSSRPRTRSCTPCEYSRSSQRSLTY